MNLLIQIATGAPLWSDFGPERIKGTAERTLKVIAQERAAAGSDPARYSFVYKGRIWTVAQTHAIVLEYNTRWTVKETGQV